MNNLQKRFILFLVGCIGTRSLLVYLAKNASKQILFYMGLLALVPASGFMYFYLSGTRKTGAEVFGGKIWWNNLRPIHALLYTMFACNAILGNSNAYMYLLVDVTFGLISFLSYHFIHLFVHLL